MLRAGADVNYQNEDGYTPLIVAALNDHAGIVGSILSTSSADLELQARDGLTPMLAALKAFRVAKRAASPVVMLALVDAGADTEVKDADGVTPLMAAVRWGRTDLVDHLLSNGADVDAKDDEGNTALHVAAQFGSIDIASGLLLERNASPNERNHQGLEPWRIAEIYGHPDQARSPDARL